MVNTGKPSRACQQCKKRRIKCDELRPTCSPCSKKNLTCSGVRHEFDVALRDQTQILINRARTKRQKSSPISDAEISSLPTGFREAVEIPQLDVVPSIAASPSESPEQTALCLWFNRYILVPQHPASKHGHFVELLPLYMSVKVESPLSYATSTAALATVAAREPQKQSLPFAHFMYSKAVRSVSEAIQDPVDSKSDAVLMAVLILGYCEMMMAAIEGRPRLQAHVRGARALMICRGTELLTSQRSKRLAAAVQSYLVSESLANGGANVTISDDIVHSATDEPENAAQRLTSMTAKLPGLLSSLKSLVRLQPVHESTIKVANLLAEILHLNETLKAWPKALPVECHYQIIENQPTKDDFGSNAYSYAPLHVYCDLHMANIWNLWRTSRIKVQRGIRLCTSWLLSNVHPDPPTAPSQPHIPFEKMRTQCQALFISSSRGTQTLVDELCATVPYHLGTQGLTGEIQDYATYPSTAEIPESTAHRQAAATLGGYLLLPHLHVGCAVEEGVLRAGQKEWMRSQIDREGLLKKAQLPLIAW